MRDVLHKRLLVCLGPGGVGKTTTAAALALSAAQAGRRAAVITFDPSHRLKDALGLSTLSSDPVEVAIEGAAFDALALDTKRTFDAVVERFAPNAETAAGILRNRLYQEISNELSGSAEYMAMEKLHELVHQHDYDLIIVDTPPSAHARDLLAAPNRLSALLASRAVGFLQAPASLLAGVDSALGRFTLTTLLRSLERWTGMELLSDLGEFVTGFEGMLAGFQERAEDIRLLLRADETGFVLITSADANTADVTAQLHHELVEDGFPVTGLIANRILAVPAPGLPDPHPRHWDGVLERKLIANQEALHALSNRDRRTIEGLVRQTGVRLLAKVPMHAVAPTSESQLAAFALELAL